jgi:tetratricopeptide (TPR) repeat protein
LDPNYAEDWALIANQYFRESDLVERTRDQRQQSLGKSQQFIGKALAIDPYNSMAYAIQGMVCLSLRKFDAAVESTNRGVELSPNHARCLALSAIVLNKSGQPEMAKVNLDKAMRLSPDYPLWFFLVAAQISRHLGEIDKAIETYQEVIDRDWDSFEGHLGLALSYSEAGLMKEGQIAASNVLKVYPNFAVKKYLDNITYRDPKVVITMKELLLRVGLPE